MTETFEVKSLTKNLFIYLFTARHYNILFTIYGKKILKKILQKSQYIFTMMCRPIFTGHNYKNFVNSRFFSHEVVTLVLWDKPLKSLILALLKKLALDPI